jgi:hypothetical protein
MSTHAISLKQTKTERGRVEGKRRGKDGHKSGPWVTYVDNLCLLLANHLKVPLPHLGSNRLADRSKNT